MACGSKTSRHFFKDSLLQSPYTRFTLAIPYLATSSRIDSIEFTEELSASIRTANFFILMSISISEYFTLDMIKANFIRLYHLFIKYLSLCPFPILVQQTPFSLFTFGRLRTDILRLIFTAKLDQRRITFWINIRCLKQILIL